MLRSRLIRTLALVALVAACRRASDLPLSGNKITGVRFAASERMPCIPCDIIIRVDSTEFHIRESTGIARVAADSTWLVFTTFGGSGGFRGAGQALWRYDVKTGNRTQVMSEYYLVEQIEILPGKRGDPLLIVSMREPLQLIRHLAIVDPFRGELFRAEQSAITATDTNAITITQWGAPTSWLVEALNDSTGLPQARPERIYRVPLDSVRKLAVLSLARRDWGQAVEFEVPQLDTFSTPGRGSEGGEAEMELAPLAPAGLPSRNKGGMGTKTSPGVSTKANTTRPIIP